ncbi:MAG: polyprenyl synthetase family protein [Planctomycetota bacterium]|jgi:octaprenyl-diphosphate synthase
MLDTLDAVSASLSGVASIMDQALHTDEPRVAELIANLGTFHGKMLRPALLLLTARCIGDERDEHRRLGAALELIHTATLIHDDLIDDGTMRRGQPTAHVRFGTSTAVLLGDYFYTHAFDLVADGNDPWVTKTITRTTNVVCEGELHQMCARRDLELSEAEYERIIYAKTAALCEAACAIGAVDGTDTMRAAAADYGRLCGMAFQIVDDCLDLEGDPEKVGKTLATDIERGRLTLPFIRALADAGPEREAFGQRLLNVSNSDDVAAIRSEVIERGGVTSAMNTARDYVAQAIAALDALPANQRRDHLRDLAQFIVSRDF